MQDILYKLLSLIVFILWIIITGVSLWLSLKGRDIPDTLFTYHLILTVGVCLILKPTDTTK